MISYVRKQGAVVIVCSNCLNQQKYLKEGYVFSNSLATFNTYVIFFTLLDLWFLRKIRLLFYISVQRKCQFTFLFNTNPFYNLCLNNIHLFPAFTLADINHLFSSYSSSIFTSKILERFSLFVE